MFAPIRMALFVALLFLPTLAFGQKANAPVKSVRIFGRVVDPTSSVIPNAEVKLRLAGQREGTIATRSDADGNFSFSGLAPVAYELKASSPGFIALWVKIPKPSAESIDLGSLVMNTPPDLFEVLPVPVLVELAPQTPQAVNHPADSRVIETTVCEVARTPERFNGKAIRVNGRVQAGFEDFEISLARCEGKGIDEIVIEYGRGPKRQPTMWCCGDLTPQDPLALHQNHEFRKFHRYLIKQQSVSATLIGRFDSAPVGLGLNGKNAHCNRGFGHFNLSCGRLVISSVSRVTSTPASQGAFR